MAKYERIPVTHNDIVTGNLDASVEAALRVAMQTNDGSVSAAALPYTTPDAAVGPVDRRRTATGSGGSFFQHGMGAGRAGSNTAFATGDYQDSTSAFGDVPLYFSLMNENNGGIMYWPVTLREKYSWYKYFYKCVYVHRYQQLVTTADGTLKPIQDIEVGDSILTAKGTIRPVAKVFKRRAKGKSVVLKSHCLQTPVHCTHHHPFYVLKNGRVESDESGRKHLNPNFEPEWIHAENVQPGDYVLLPPMAEEIDSGISKREARFLGYYAAEGSMVWGERCIGTDINGKGYKHGQEKVRVPVGVAFTIGKHEELTLGKGIFDAARVFNKEAKIVRRRDNHIEILVSGRDVGEFCLYHVGVGSSDKRLSQELMQSPKDSRLEFLVGYAGGDGCQYDGKSTNKGKLVISTSSDYLASQTQMLAISCGIMCRIAEYKRTLNSGYKASKETFWHISIPANAANILYQKSNRWSEVQGEKRFCGALMINGYAAFKVKAVEISEEDDEVYNLHIDAEGDENSFICNGMSCHNTDPFVGSAIDIHTDLPLSRLKLRMPKLKDKKLGKKIEAKYRQMVKRLRLFDHLQAVVHDFFLIGNVFVFIEWNDEKKEWQKLLMLPPEDVDVKPIPFTEKMIVRYCPVQLMGMIQDMIDEKGSLKGDPGEEDLDCRIEEEVRANIPLEIVEMVDKYAAIIFDTSPYEGDGESEVGSFVHHLSRRRVPYLELGVSIVERVLIPLLMKEHYKYTQLSLAMRNMTPKNRISAEGITPPQLDELREQVDLSYLDPDYTVMTNYAWEWEQIGADNRLLDLQREYEVIENQLFAGLGVTRELLTGDSAYSGSRINVEIMNTRYMLIRDILKDYVEESLFRPMAVANGWYELDENGEKVYIYPTLGFHRITIRDNQEVFDTLFQLYQKGSLPIDILYEVLNIDSDEIHAQLAHDLFTVKDAMFNETIRQASSDAGTFLSENTDLNERISKYLNLKVTGGAEEEEGMGDMGGFGGDEDSAAVEPEYDDNIGLGYGIDDLVPTGITTDGIRKPFGIQGKKPKEKQKPGPKLKELTDIVQNKVSDPANRDEVRDAILQIENQESQSEEE